MWTQKPGSLDEQNLPLHLSMDVRMYTIRIEYPGTPQMDHGNEGLYIILTIPKHAILHKVEPMLPF